MSNQDFVIENGVLTEYNGSGGDVVIPEGIMKIGSNAFGGCTSLTSITIPKGVKKIGFWAFQGCTSLTSIILPEGVQQIDTYTFQGCTALASITIPKGVQQIGSCAFQGCTTLTSIIISEGVQWIDPYVFQGCTALTNITIPDSVTEIAESAFHNCTSLTNIILPKGVKKIGSYVFQGCTALTSITIPAGVTEIGEGAFHSCTSLTSIIISEGVQRIGSYVFQDCIALTSITIPDSVTEIEAGAFLGCTSLTSITIPKGVTKISSYIFYGCTGLTDITIPETVEEIEESAFANTGLRSIHIPAAVHLGIRLFGGSALESLTISPENPRHHIADGVVYDGQDALFCLPNWKGPVSLEQGTKKIAWQAFAGCQGITEITIPETVTSIGANAFSGCLGLRSLALPPKLKKISAYMANECANLEQMDWPEALESIGKNAFAGTALKSLTLGGKLKEVGGHAFARCGQLEQVVVEADGLRLPVECFWLSPVKRLIVLGAQTKIVPTAFDWDSMERIEAELIPLKELPKGRCKDLVIASFCQAYLAGKEPPQLEERLKYIKSQRKNLFSVAVEKPEVLQLMCQQKYLTNQDIDPLLEECDRQNNVAAKATVMEYANRQLKPVDPLEEMEKQMAKEERLLQHIEKTGSLPLGELKKIWSYEKLKDGSLGLTSYKGKTGPDVTIPAMIGKDPVTVIGWGTFSPDGKPKAIREARQALQSVTIPEGVTKIEYWAFQGCVNLTTVTLPKSISKIEEYAFGNCSENLVFRVPKNCYASRWAKRNGFAVQLL